jgi:hypothetical protein
MAFHFSLILVALPHIDAKRVGIVSILELPAAGIITCFWLVQRLDSWQITVRVLVLIGKAILQYKKAEKVLPKERKNFL